MKKITILSLLILLFAFVLSACGSKEKTESEKVSEQSTAKPETIRIGYVPSAGILQVLYIVAKEKQYFEEEFKEDGIKIEHRNFQSGPVLVEALKGKSLDIGHVGDQPFIQANANGTPLTAIALHSMGDKNYGLVVPNNSSVKSPKDLKGKKVAVTIGSIGHRILDLYLSENNLTMKDVEAVNIPPADIKNTLAAGNVDAAIIWEPWISQIENENIGKQISNTEGLKKNVNPTIASEEFVKKYPEITKRFVAVYEKTRVWVEENPEEAARIVANDAGFDEKVFFEAMKDEEYTVKITNEAIASMEDTAKFLKENNIIRKDVNIDDIVDSSFTE